MIILDAAENFLPLTKRKIFRTRGEFLRRKEVLTLELKPNEKSVLEQVYGKIVTDSGYSANKITKIREITSDEAQFFERKTFASPHFCVQTLYKVRGEIKPIQFNRAVNSLLEEDENFRANFCNVGTRTVKVIFEKHTTLSEIIFRMLRLDGDELDETLTKIMEADRRKGFDLQRDYLIRFSVFQTAPNEAAVLVTMSQLIADRFSDNNFFSAVLDGVKYKKISPPPSTSQTTYMEMRVRDYWLEVLKNLPPLPKVPYAKEISGEYREQAYRMKIPAEILSDLRVRTQGSRAMLMVALQTAWGFLLQAMNNSSDTIFCQLVSKTSANGKFALNLMPVRLKSDWGATLENLVGQQFKQLVVSQPYSSFDWAEEQKQTSRRGKLFDHFLSFLDFKAEEKFYSQVQSAPEGIIVARNFWDAQRMKLGVYFQYTEKNLSVTFQYDGNQFFLDAGERLAETYALVLRRMLVYWNAPFKEFMENLKDQIFIGLESVAQFQRQDEKKIIADFVSKNKILQGEKVGTAQLFSDAKILTRFEGDRLSGDTLDKNLVFVVEGKIARNLETGDGWFNTLDIVKAGGWLNETVFLQKRRAIISAEVLTEKATLMLVPLTKMEEIIRERPDLHHSILRHALQQMEKYQTLWLQS